MLLVHLNNEPKYLDWQFPGPFTDTGIYLQEEDNSYVLTHKKINGTASQYTAGSFNHMDPYGSVLTKINANQV